MEHVHATDFQGRTYCRIGRNGFTIAFADRLAGDHDRATSGVVTLEFASEFDHTEKGVMARRIMVLLNLTSSYTLGHLERAIALTVPEPALEYGGFCGRPFRRHPGPVKFVIGFDGRCPVSGIFGKNGGFAMLTYAEQLNDAEKEIMTRRLLAAMNYTRNLSLDSLEKRYEDHTRK